MISLTQKYTLRKPVILLIILLAVIPVFSQNIDITFTGIGESTVVENVLAKNLSTGGSINLPGNETLVLEDASGIPNLQEEIFSGHVFPNPFPGKTTLELHSATAVNAHISVRNYIGQVLAQSEELLTPGNHQYNISLNKPGLYFIYVTSDKFNFYHKVVCSETTQLPNSISYYGEGSTWGNTQKSLAPKSFQSSYSLAYTKGDILSFSGQSGTYTTIITDSPDYSRSYEIQFIECLDPDGKNYPVVHIGNQFWMAENLAYLPDVSPPSTRSNTEKHYYVYGYEGSSISSAKGGTNYSTYGVLYNWEAAQTTCPEGWNLPSDEDWKILEQNQGMSGADAEKEDLRISGAVGGKLKETGTNNWNTPNTGANNFSQFSVFPGGYLGKPGVYRGLGEESNFWTSSENSSNFGWSRSLFFNNDGVDRASILKSHGLTVRCIRSPRVDLPTITTANITSITEVSAEGGGDVTSGGGASVTTRGVCWNTTGDPTTSDYLTSDGAGTGTFTSNLTGLTENTTYYVRAYASNSGGTAYGGQKEFATDQGAGLPIVTTDDITNITETTADGGGEVTSDGGASVSARGVCWNTTGSPATSDNLTSDGSGTGTFTSSLTGLTENTTYYVRAYATNSVGTAYGEQKQFTTDQGAGLPTVTTNDITNITETSADGGGDVTDDGGASVTARGVCWNTTGSPTTSDDLTSDGSGTGTFTSNLTGLTENTTYFVRAYATNSEGTAYGEQKQFTTDQAAGLPTVTTDDIANITETTADSGGEVTGDGGASVTARGVCWNLAGSPTISDDLTSDETGTGTFTSNLTGLTENTTYYVRAYATNSEGTAYGEQKEFTTDQGAGIPTVTTADITNIRANSADSGGEITYDGGTNVIAMGVCWNTSGSPTKSDYLTDDGYGTGTFTSNLTGLTGNTTYYVRAYATNSVGTAYGEQKEFSTLPGVSGSFTDSRDGNTYDFQSIGTQIWMIENLAYLPYVSGKERFDEPMYYVYNYGGYNISDAKATDEYRDYGVLYNWHAATEDTHVNGQDVCPTGWHLPSDIEWTTLTNYLINNAYGYEGSGDDIGKSLAANSGWNISEIPGTIGNDQGSNNSSGFNAFPSGYFTAGGGSEIYGRFYRLSERINFWSSSPDESLSSWGRSLDYLSLNMVRESYHRSVGISVRCLKNENTSGTPYVVTSNIYNITETSAQGGGNVISDGGAAVSSRGVCWNTTGLPTTNDNLTDDEGTGIFTSNITGLTDNTTYYVRAYAINSEGTSYGDQKQFTTQATIHTFTDSRDENTYDYKAFGTQTWMIENLAYLPAVAPSLYGSTTDPFYYVYDYIGFLAEQAKNQANYHLYGVLYNYEAAKIVCPDGWHLPSDEEWKTLEIYLGMSESRVNSFGGRYSGIVGIKLKSVSGWDSSGNGDNSSDFNVFPGGYRDKDKFFAGIGSKGIFWSESKIIRILTHDYGGVYRQDNYSLDYGLSVRCVKD